MACTARRHQNSVDQPSVAPYVPDLGSLNGDRVDSSVHETSALRLMLVPGFPHISESVCGRYRRGMEPPDPHQIATALREQLRLLRSLAEMAPERAEYAIVAELVTRALIQLEKQTAVPAW